MGSCLRRDSCAFEIHRFQAGRDRFNQLLQQLAQTEAEELHLLIFKVEGMIHPNSVIRYIYIFLKEHPDWKKLYKSANIEGSLNHRRPNNYEGFPNAVLPLLYFTYYTRAERGMQHIHWLLGDRDCSWQPWFFSTTTSSTGRVMLVCAGDSFLWMTVQAAKQTLTGTKDQHRSHHFVTNARWASLNAPSLIVP